MSDIYNLEIESEVDKKFKKLAKKVQLKAINSKIKEVLKNPYRFKQLRKPLQNKRRIHIGSFVLTYEIDEKRKTVMISEYEHHDDIYKI